MNDQDKANDCQERREHGRATEPRFEVKLPPQPAEDVYGSLLGEDLPEKG